MKIFFTALLFTTGLFFAPSVFAAEQTSQFDATIQIRSDAAIEVTESIAYDFGNEQRHGIFRDIPISYKARGGNFSLRISDISVVDEIGKPYQFTTSFPGSNVQLKIGDPDVLITARHVYVIKYTIKRAMNYFKDHDELYWNVTGNDWHVGILGASVNIILPKTIDSQTIQTDCFAGVFGSTKKCRDIQKKPFQTDRVLFDHSPLNPGEGLTIVLGIPKGVVDQPSAWASAMETARDNWVVVVPVLVFAICFYLWYKRGRDPKGRGVIIAQYEAPDDLSPAEVGTIVDEKAQNKDITAEIIFLATKGYLKIRQIETKVFMFANRDYELTTLKSDFGSLNEYQKILTEGMQKESTNGVVKLSELKNKFYKDLSKAIEKTYESVTQKGYFASNPNRMRGIFAVVGFIAIMSGVFVGSAMGFIGGASVVFSGIFLIIFGLIMPARTKKGVDSKEYILGLKLYMSVAEKRRLEFHNAPEKKPEQFEKLLPYAMALGVEKEWAKQFEGMYTQNPSWYSGPAGGAFNAVIFANSMNSFTSSANSALASSPSSAAGGGSGFSGGGSGGGGGGGGGGSW